MKAALSLRLLSFKRVFERLFVPETATDRVATLRRYNERRSILDNVLQEAKSLHNRLGQTDQKKLDECLNSVRETEQRVERLEDCNSGRTHHELETIRRTSRHRGNPVRE